MFTGSREHRGIKNKWRGSNNNNKCPTRTKTKLRSTERADPDPEKNHYEYGCSEKPPIGRLVVTPVMIVFTNRGDVAIHDMVATFSTNVSSLVGTALTATTYPLGIIGQTTFHLFTLLPYSSQTETLLIRSAVYCSALAPLNVVSSYTNVVGTPVQQPNTVTLEVGSGSCPNQQLPGGGTLLP
ncbi:MAG: hypothetical protein WAM14_15215 [Candidatus Nitrosopolaris sp.]